MTEVYHTLQFGAIEVREEEIIRFPEGLLGFPQYERYILLEDPAQEPFVWLQCLDNTDLSFVVVDPQAVLPGYSIQVPREEVEILDLEDPTKARIYAICVVPKDIVEVSANLKGPIIVNPSNRKARQIVLNDERYSTKYQFLKRSRQPQDAKTE